MSETTGNAAGKLNPQQRRLDERKICAFKQHLLENEKSDATIEKYVRDVRKLWKRAKNHTITKERMIEYKRFLMESSSSINSINSYIVSINVFFTYMEWNDLKIKTCRVQQETAQADERYLSKEDYKKMIRAAKYTGNHTLLLIMETLASTGMRVSELQFLSAETVDAGMIQVYNKGKVRSVLLTDRIQSRLKEYCIEKEIRTGCVFRNKKGAPLSRTTIWRQMKRLCKFADVDEKKVYAHNLRRLFATELYGIDKDLACVADALGHYSVNTTRRYIRPSYSIYRKTLEQLDLVDE